jgi:hypothetical protein
MAKNPGGNDLIRSKQNPAAGKPSTAKPSSDGRASQPEEIIEPGSVGNVSRTDVDSSGSK